MASLKENSTNTISIILDRFNAASEIVDVNETGICQNHCDRGQNRQQSNSKEL